MKRLAPCALLLLLSACAFGPGDFTCPETGVMEQAARATLFRETGKKKKPGPEDVTASAVMAQPRGTCALTRGGKAEIAFSLDISARKGPAGERLAQQDFSYFVAVLSPDETILQRDVFYTTVDLTEGSTGLVTAEHTVTLPLADAAQAGGYKVVTGFILPPGQHAFDRTHP